MTREGTRPLAAFIAAALIAALLAACGGSDSDSGSSTEATTTGSSASSGSTAGDSGNSQDSSQSGQAGGQDRNQSKDDQSQRRQSGGGSGPGNVAAPLEVSGGGSEQFRVKGGDNSIQEYGDEGAESELQETAEIVHGFYVARAEEKWDTACSYLAKSNIEQLEQLGAQASELKNAGCAPILKAFTRPLPAAVQRQVTTVDAGSFRRDGEQGFLIYFGADQTVYAMPLIDEGGTWKVAALSGNPLG